MYLKYDVLLYDLTSTYFESSPPEDPDDPRRFGYSRDKRPDCVQVVIALIVTPDDHRPARPATAGPESTAHHPGPKNHRHIITTIPGSCRGDLLAAGYDCQSLTSADQRQ